MKALAFSALERLKQVPKLHEFVLQILRVVYKPYYSLQDAEFWHEHWITTSLARCVEGRPLGEASAGPHHMVPAFELVDRVGRLPGSREGLPVNQIALQAVMRNWQPAIQVLLEIRAEYVRQRNLATGRLNYVNLLCLAKVSSALPAYLLRRKATPFDDGGIPEPIAAIFKLTLGVRATVEAMINRGHQFDPSASPDANELYEYVDSTGEFVSHRKAACGGPPGKVVDLFNVLISGEYDSGDPGTRALCSLAALNDVPSAVRYGYGTATMETAIALCKARATAIFVNDDFEKSAKICGKQDEFMRIKAAAINDSSYGDRANDYWREKVNSLEAFFQEQTCGNEFAVTCAADNGISAEGLHADSPDSSFSKTLHEAIARYNRLLDSGHATCIQIQQEINQSLGLQRAGQFSRRDFAKRVNGQLYAQMKSISH